MGQGQTGPWAPVRMTLRTLRPYLRDFQPPTYSASLALIYEVDKFRRPLLLDPLGRARHMSALTQSEIPSDINTYERLAVWACQCLQSIANGKQVNVVAGTTSTPIAQVQLAKTADNVDRWVLSAYLPVNYDEVNSADAKTWMATLDISESAPNSNLLSN